MRSGYVYSTGHRFVTIYSQRDDSGAPSRGGNKAPAALMYLNTFTSIMLINKTTNAKDLQPAFNKDLFAKSQLLMTRTALWLSKISYDPNVNGQMTPICLWIKKKTFNLQTLSPNVTFVSGKFAVTAVDLNIPGYMMNSCPRRTLSDCSIKYSITD